VSELILSYRWYQLYQLRNTLSQFSGLRRNIHFSSHVTILFLYLMPTGVWTNCLQISISLLAYASVNSCGSCLRCLCSQSSWIKCSWMIDFGMSSVIDNCVAFVEAFKPDSCSISISSISQICLTRAFALASFFPIMLQWCTNYYFIFIRFKLNKS